MYIVAIIYSLSTFVAPVVPVETGLSPNDVVSCRTDQFCASNPITTTRHECCRTTGIAYTVEGVEGCLTCPGNHCT